MESLLTGLRSSVAACGGQLPSSTPLARVACTWLCGRRPGSDVGRLCSEDSRTSADGRVEQHSRTMKAARRGSSAVSGFFWQSPLGSCTRLQHLSKGVREAHEYMVARPGRTWAIVRKRRDPVLMVGSSSILGPQRPRGVVAHRFEKFCGSLW